MSIYRVVKDKDNPYVMINKGAIRDRQLSWKAKGLLAYLLSMPDDWQIYETELIKHTTDGRDATRSAIKELIAAGYIERSKARIRDEKGLLKGYEYRIYETSVHVGKSNVGETYIGKSNTTNTYGTNTNKKDIIPLPEGEDCFLDFYLKAHKHYLNKDHVGITNQQLQTIKDGLNEIEQWVEYDDWVEAVEEHFRTLPKGNNGNILAFLKASYRYFQVAT